MSIGLEFGLVCTADATVTEYGPLRLAVAEWANKDPATVTPGDVAQYEVERDEESQS